MNNFQLTMDKFAIGISSLCVVHCLLTPLILVLIPSFSIIGLEAEWFHKLMVATVIPTSIVSLGLGCNKHKDYKLLALGFLGVSILLIALIFEEFPLIETALTLLGAVLIAFIHYLNFRLCSRSNDPECH